MYSLRQMLASLLVYSGLWVPNWLAILIGQSFPTPVVMKSWDLGLHSESRISDKEKCCMLGKDLGKMERKAGPFLHRGTEQTYRPHNPTTVVMLYLADSMTTRWHPPTYTCLHHTALKQPHLQLTWKAAG